MVWGASFWGVYSAVRGFSTWGGCPSSFAVNQAAGCVSFGVCRGEGLELGGAACWWGVVIYRCLGQPFLGLGCVAVLLSCLMVREVSDDGGITPGGLVIWSWFGGGRGISGRCIIVITGFGVYICLWGINSSVNSTWVIYRPS